MILSVIIVNFNVRLLLEQCLSSIASAARGVNGDLEILVVDNGSTDGSTDHLSLKFPAVRFFRNTENVGFAVACNQGLAAASGRFVLFLNPDTVLPEDGLSDCIDFLESHVDAGALGVRMIDGSGAYLPESKRGFPTPAASFYKLSGLIRLFPGSKRIAAYYHGDLDPLQTGPVNVISGAFMMVRKSTLDLTGGFDERFFMYAEDIDLSYRIGQAGFVNYYFPGVTIIHYKGESTTHDRRYVRIFYRAMDQFVQKYSGHHSALSLAALRGAIFLRERMAAWPVMFRSAHPAPARVLENPKKISWKQSIANLDRRKSRI